MIGTVEQGDLDIHHGIASHGTEHGALDTGIDSGDILLGDGAAHHGIDKLVALTGLVGLHVDLHMTVLALQGVLRVQF